MKKSTEERDISDLGPHLQRHANSWVLLSDKGYQGAAEFVRAVTPGKKPAHGSLIREDEAYNKEIPSDTLIVEIFFGRVRQLCGVKGQTCRWGESLYDVLARMCVALTNVRIHYHRSRNADKTFFNPVRTRHHRTGAYNAKKRRRAQQLYREKRLRLIESTPRVTQNDGDDVVWRRRDTTRVASGSLRRRQSSAVSTLFNRTQ